MNNRFVGIALLAVGVVLLIFGINASESVASEFSKLFTGSPTDKAIWLLLGGIVLTAVGLGMVAFPRRGGPALNP